MVKSKANLPNMRSKCVKCDKRSVCKEPCEWLIKQLKGVETAQEFPTFTDLNIKID